MSYHYSFLVRQENEEGTEEQGDDGEDDDDDDDSEDDEVALGMQGRWRAFDKSFSPHSPFLPTSHPSVSLGWRGGSRIEPRKTGQ